MLAEEPLGGSGIASALHQDVEHVTVLVHCAPEKVQFAADADEHLVREPFVARPRPTALQLVREQPAEAQPPVPDGLVADHNTPRRKDQLDVTQAEAEAVVQPHCMLNDLGWISKASVRAGGHHAAETATLPPDPPT